MSNATRPPLLGARRIRALGLIAIAALLGIVATARILLWMEPQGHARDPTLESTSTPIAILGDSDSQSYHDWIWLPKTPPTRGGDYRETTLQWTEVLNKLRPKDVDLGEWGTWGSRSKAVLLMGWLGVHGRAPRKQDFRYNFAFSGARTFQLMEGNWRQTPRLVALMDKAPDRWQKGVVVIRIGVNNFGNDEATAQIALDSKAPQVRATIAECLGYIKDAVALIREHHKQTRIVLVGIGDNSDYPANFGRWRSRAELDNIRAGLDAFDDALREMASSDSRVVFFDERAWFTSLWGSRDAQGVPAYRAVTIGEKLKVENSIGDAPTNACLEDGHAGVVWNTLWAKALVDLLIKSFDIPIQPISDSDVTRFLEQELKLGG